MDEEIVTLTRQFVIDMDALLMRLKAEDKLSGQTYSHMLRLMASEFNKRGWLPERRILMGEA